MLMIETMKKVFNMKMSESLSHLYDYIIICSILTLAKQYAASVSSFTFYSLAISNFFLYISVQCPNSYSKTLYHFSAPYRMFY